jgi:hypothetical protein
MTDRATVKLGGKLRAACPVHCCKVGVPPDKFMCPKHWSMVPADLQRQIYATWKARLKHVKAIRDAGGHEAYLKAKEKHEEAKALALQAVHLALGYT